MHRGPYITDLRHLMDERGALVQAGPAGRFAIFLAHVACPTEIPRMPLSRWYETRLAVDVSRWTARLRNVTRSLTSWRRATSRRVGGKWR
jgi:hypothetical protein